METVLPILQKYHLLGMFVMLLACGFGFPLPEDVVLIAGGFLASEQPQGSILQSVIVAYCGVIIGDSIMYYIGYRLGHRVLTWPRLRFLFPPERRARVERAFQKWGAYAVFFGRFAAGIRAAVFLTAGSMRIPYRTFFVFDSLAAMLSVPLFIWLGFEFAAHREQLFSVIATIKIYLLIALVLALVTYLFYRAIKRRKAA